MRTVAWCMCGLWLLLQAPLSSQQPDSLQGPSVEYVLLGSPTGPEAVPGQGKFAALDPNAATFKEENYISDQEERLRYTQAEDFIFNFPSGEGSLTEGPGGNSLQVTIDNKPGMLRSEGLSQSLFTLVPCGLNVPHLHPRASKVMHVLAGTVLVGFHEENEGRVIEANISAGQSFMFPRGVVMWLHNLGCVEAQYLDTWSNNDPGILNIVPALASAPVYTIAAALGINTDAAQQLQNADYSKIAIGPDECLAACNQTDAGALSAPENPAFNEQMTSG